MSANQANTSNLSEGEKNAEAASTRRMKDVLRLKEEALACAHRQERDQVPVFVKVSCSTLLALCEIAELAKKYDGSHSLDQWDVDLMPSREWVAQLRAATKKVSP